MPASDWSFRFIIHFSLLPHLTHNSSKIKSGKENSGDEKSLKFLPESNIQSSVSSRLPHTANLQIWLSSSFSRAPSRATYVNPQSSAREPKIEASGRFATAPPLARRPRASEYHENSTDNCLLRTEWLGHQLGYLHGEVGNRSQRPQHPIRPDEILTCLVLQPQHAPLQQQRQDPDHLEPYP